MQMEEFLKIKEELIAKVIEFEGLERKISLLNQSYFIEFHEELEQQRYLQYENDYLIKAIAMHSDGKSEEEIKDFLNQCKKEFSRHIQEFRQQYRLALDMERVCSKYSQLDFESVDKAFVDYCSEHHPLVQAYSTEDERKVYQALITVYRLGNIEGFKNLLKESEHVFSSTEVLESEYEDISRIYKESLDQMKKVIQELTSSFPLNKESMFYDEALFTREHIALREKNYQSREMNQALQKDFQLHFSFPFTLS
ncbi:MAG: hypothetical protein K2N64_02795 [Anaeroplasmataceae bacterium]|nr:hypothetical protein [Anaeroplasmataceae bacterium]